MKNLCSKLIKDTQGFAITMFLLMLIPLSLVLIISLSEIANTSRIADKTVNYAVANAVKSAAMMVDPESQAQGNPHIAYERAYEEFIKNVKYSLMLDENGNATPNSSIDGTVKYWVLIYNGDDMYEGYTENYKVSSYAYYTSEGGTFANPLSEINNTITGMPKTIYVNNSGLTDAEEGKKVILNEPGVIAVIQTEGKSIAMNKSETITRWAYGKIVKRKVGE